MGETDRRTRRTGRRTKPLKGEATLPGKILLLAFLSAVPILWLFIIGPLARPGQLAIQAFPLWRVLFLVGTPLAAASALTLYYRAPPWAREHNAAKMGRILSLANGVMWLLYGSLYVWLFVLNEPPTA